MLSQIYNVINTNITNSASLPLWFILLCQNRTNKVNKLLESAPHQVQTGVVKDAAVIESTRLATELLGSPK